MKTRLVIATRETEAGFFSNRATGQSLSGKQVEPFEVRVFAQNSRGLPAVYNDAIREAQGDDVALVFVHDDVFFLDYFWVERLREGLEQFDLVGLAGNRRRAAGQPAWAFLDTRFTWDARENLSGVIGQGPAFKPEAVLNFGPSRQRVKLLDGTLLAIRSRTLRDKGLHFDERFDFHHYDLDFCRQAEVLGLTAGTWDLSIVHQSYGGFLSDAWNASLLRYLEKWGE